MTAVYMLASSELKQEKKRNCLQRNVQAFHPPVIRVAVILKLHSGNPYKVNVCVACIACSLIISTPKHVFPPIYKLKITQPLNFRII